MLEKEILENLKDINLKLERLLVIIAAQGKENDIQIKILTKAGFTSEEISSLIGIPPGTISWKRSQNVKTKKVNIRKKK